MRPLRFEGTYVDVVGSEPVTWQIRSSARRGWDGRYEISTTIRGVDVRGFDFDGLEPVDRDAAVTGRMLALNAACELADCVLTGQLPCTVEVSGEPVATTVHFELDLHHDTDRSRTGRKKLRLSTTIDDTDHVVVDDWFEDGLLQLGKALGPDRLRCCMTCLYSDYSPAGHGLMGMRCHRDARDRCCWGTSWPAPAASRPTCSGWPRSRRRR